MIIAKKKLFYLSSDLVARAKWIDINQICNNSRIFLSKFNQSDVKRLIAN